MSNPEASPPEATKDHPGDNGAAPEASTEVAVPEENAALAVVRDLPIVPARRELQDLAATAVTLAMGNLVPPALRGKPNDTFLVLLTGRDLGIRITTALRELHVIEGRITVSPKVKLALLRERPDIGQAWADEANSEWEATWYGRRVDQPDVVYKSTVNWDDAQRVCIRTNDKGECIKSLTDKDNWKNYPKRMLSWRALGYLMDDAFGEIGTGLYSPDELGAVTNEEGEPLDIVDVEALADGMAMPRKPEKPEPLSDETKALYSARAMALPEAAKPALSTFWRTSAKLPKIADLMRSQQGKAEAAIRHFEDRARKGEWGEWSADGPAEAGGGGEAPDGEVQGQTSASPTEATATPPCEADPDQEGPPPPPGCAHPADQLEVRTGDTVSTVCHACGLVFDDEHEDGWRPEEQAAQEENAAADAAVDRAVAEENDGF